jgi:ribonuclease HI
MKARRVRAHVDSLLVANQIGGSYEAKEPSMKQYLAKAQELIKGFDDCVIVHVPRSKNKKVDALSKLASVTFSHLAKEIRVEVLKAPSISEVEVR